VSVIRFATSTFDIDQITPYAPTTLPYFDANTMPREAAGHVWMGTMGRATSIGRSNYFQMTNGLVALG
jgi:hypothetical protein